MNSPTRVLTALARRVPDCVPYMYSFIDTELQEQILGKGLADYRFDLSFDPGVIAEPGETVRWKLNYLVHPETAEFLGLDTIGIRFPLPLFCRTRLGRAGHSIEKGLLNSREALTKVRMPDVNDERIYREAEEFIRRFRGKFALMANIRLGASALLMSMGYDHFSYLLYDDRPFVYDALELYTSWVAQLVCNLNELKFDLIWAFDDIAFKSGPLFSHAVWNDVFVPRLKTVTDEIKIPWIYHSDGNLLPILDDMLPLGMSGLHPLEPGAMDLSTLKARYGRRLCLIGNVDIDPTLSRARPEEVEAVVKERIDLLAPGGGYIISDSNSVPYFCKPENVVAMSRAVQKYRWCY